MDSLLDNAPCGFLVFRDNGEIVQANKTLLLWLGYETLAGHKTDNILTLASRIFYNTHFFPIVKLHQRADEIFLTLATKDKQDIPVLANAVRKTDGPEAVTHCVFVPVRQRHQLEDEILQAKRAAENALKDNTQLKSLTASLERQAYELDQQYKKLSVLNQNLLQFSKIVSHDLQEPIRKIALNADILKNRQPDMSSGSKILLDRINSAAEKLKMLTEGLRHYITVDSEKDDVPVDLNAVLQAAKTSVVDHRKFDSFELITDELPSVVGYKQQLQLMFYHLIDNAIQFRDPSRLLTISVKSMLLEENLYRATKDRYKFADHTRILFSDNGIGFDDSYRSYVFDLLKKISPTTTGLGIGLSLIKKIVDNHSGTIDLRSERGTGTTVAVTLPVNNKVEPEM
jgi:sigma-B regulation protein RsbU (phosphoserine phosphatase)